MILSWFWTAQDLVFSDHPVWLQTLWDESTSVPMDETVSKPADFFWEVSVDNHNESDDVWDTLEDIVDGWFSELVLKLLSENMEQSWRSVFPRVSGTNFQTKIATRAHTTPWKKKRKWMPSALMTVGTMEERRTIVQPRTSCAMDAPMFLWEQIGLSCWSGCW